MRIAAQVIFLLYVTSLLTSMAGMELFSWLLFAMALIQMGIDIKAIGFNKVLEKLRLGPDLWLLGFFGWTVLGALVQMETTEQRLTIVGYVRWVFLLYAFSYLLRTHLSETWEKGFRWLLVLFIVVGVYAIWQGITGDDLFREDNSHLRKMMPTLYRATGFYNISLTFAYAIGVAGFLVISYFAVVKAKLWKHGFWISGVASFSVLLCLVLSGSRGAWLGIFPAGLLMFSFLGRKALLTAVATAAVFVLGVVLVQPRLSDRFATMTDVHESSNAGRVKIWRANAAMFFDHPIFGTGLNYNSKLLTTYYDKLKIEDGLISHAHNNFLQTLVGTGIPGFIAFLVFCGYFVWLAYFLWIHLPKEAFWFRSIALGALAGQIFFHVGGLTECNFIDGEVNHNLIFIWALLAAIYWQSGLVRKQARL